MPETRSPSRLTANDERILDDLFDPESSATKQEAVIDPNLPSLPGIQPQQLQALRDREGSIIRPLDTPEPSLEAVENGILQLTYLLDANLAYSSAYVNRAQARRLPLAPLEDISDFPDAVRGRELVLSDLSEAITLATPAAPPSPVSALEAELLSKAYTHRAYVVHMATKADNLPSAIQGFFAGDGGVREASTGTPLPNRWLSRRVRMRRCVTPSLKRP